jgi:multicomponent Na+:H+ antiporter subunit E
MFNLSTLNGNRTIGHFILRLTIWFLLTANFTIANAVIGIAIALLLPYPNVSRAKLTDLLRGLAKIFLAIPQAYLEAFQLIFNPHLEEEIVREAVPSGRSSGLIFLDIFLITFTPKTTVLRYDKEGWYEVHRVKSKE